MRTREEYLALLLWVLFVAVQVTTDPVALTFAYLLIVMTGLESFGISIKNFRAWRKDKQQQEVLKVWRKDRQQEELKK